MLGRDAVFDPNVSFAMLYNVKSASAPSVALPKARCFDDDEVDEEDVTDEEEEDRFASDGLPKSMMLPEGML